MCQRVEHFVDRRYAHYDRRGLTQAPPTFDDIRRALEEFERIIKRYRILLDGVTQTSLLPTPQYDWQEIFTIPWKDAVPAREED